MEHHVANSRGREASVPTPALAAPILTGDLSGRHLLGDLVRHPVVTFDHLERLLRERLRLRIGEVLRRFPEVLRGPPAIVTLCKNLIFVYLLRDVQLVNRELAKDLRCRRCCVYLAGSWV
jgi:hypothetical protein